MIKLKKILRIALAISVVSAMLIACDSAASSGTGGSTSGDNTVNSGNNGSTSGDNTANSGNNGSTSGDNTANSGNGNKGKISGGEGIYSYTVKIENISSKWGGSAEDPAFSIVLLTEEQLKIGKEKNDFYLPKETFAYEINTYGTTKIPSMSIGNFGLYGVKPVDGVYKYYTGVAATVTESDLTVYVDMSKLILSDLRVHFLDEYNEVTNYIGTDNDIVDLTDYKPYIVALADEEVDSERYEFSGWNDADFMRMDITDTFPDNAEKPALYAPNELTHIYGTITEEKHIELEGVIDGRRYRTYIFKGADNVEFVFTNGSSRYKVGGGIITELDKGVELKEYADEMITVKAKLESDAYYYAALYYEDEKPYAKISQQKQIDLTVKVTNLPEKVKVLSFWGTPNDFNYKNVIEEQSKYIVDVIDGTATFTFEKYECGVAFRCQFVPLISKDPPVRTWDSAGEPTIELDSDNWWRTAFSGSTDYYNMEGNSLVYYFESDYHPEMTLTLDVEEVYGGSYDISGSVFSYRFHTENYGSALKASW